MSKQKARNRWFIIKVVLLVMVITGAVVCVVVSSIALASSGFSWVYGSLLVTSLFSIPWGILRIKRLNGEWMLIAMAEIRSGVIKAGFNWKIDVVQWAKFMEWRKVSSKEEVHGLRLWSSILAIIIFFIMAWSQLDILELIVVSIVGGSVFGMVIGSLFGWGLQVQLRKLNVSNTGHIIFTPNAILMNDLLVSFNQMGSRLSQIQLIEKAGLLMICLTVETRAGERRNTHSYYIPVPIEYEDEASHLLSYYGLESID